MTRAPRLESFDPDPVTTEVEAAGPSDDWHAGHAEGLSQGRREAAADTARLTEDLVQTLADLSFPLAEAEVALSDRLVPLFAAVAASVLPPLVPPALVAQLVTLLAEAGRTDLSGPITIRVSPAQAPEVAAALDRVPGLRARVSADPLLTTGAARLTVGPTETSLDLAAAAAAVADILTSLGPLLEEMRHHA